MSASIALFIWFVLLVGLLRFDPAKERKTSTALWVPLIWMFLVATRLPAQWLDSSEVSQSAQAMEEGSPVDRTVLSFLILLAVLILISRSFKWGAFVAHNWALMSFLAFALVSFVWSDFPLITLKRWFRDFGNYLIVLVVLSDPRPQQAIALVLRRLFYVLITLSVLLIKYYPGISRQYDVFSGAPMDVGPTTSKNMLGLVCLISGVFFFWDTVTRWVNRRERRTRRIILVNVAFLAMTLWVLHVARSTTSQVCLVLGCLVVAAAHNKVLRRRTSFMKAMPVIMVFSYLILALGLGLNGQLAGAVGKDPTLTDRTKIWEILLSMHTNPLVGTGYQSFWLGSRLQWFWDTAGLGHLNEAHNGYLDVYLNLGLLGLLLLIGLLASSYRTICRRLGSPSNFASHTLAVWTIIVFYNMTEAAFQGGLLWMLLLSGAIVVPARFEDKVCELLPVPPGHRRPRMITPSAGL